MPVAALNIVGEPDKKPPDAAGPAQTLVPPLTLLPPTQVRAPPASSKISPRTRRLNSMGLRLIVEVMD